LLYLVPTSVGPMLNQCFGSLRIQPAHTDKRVEGRSIQVGAMTLKRWAKRHNRSS
jgi:hypothetical protein